jgi:CheY-like chemotaxis protein
MTNLPARIMVVDDDEMIRFSIKSYFKYHGVDVDVANGGEECLEYLKKGFKGVILMDLNMPGMDGWHTVKAIVDGGFSDGNSIVLLTASYDIDEAMEPFQKYIVGCVMKPFELEELFSRTKEYLEVR